MKWTSAFCLTCIFHCAAFSVSEGSPAQDPVFHRGDSLFARGDYFEAGIAFERIYFQSGDPLVRAQASLRKSQALKQQGEYARAVNDLQRSLPYAREDSLQEAILYEMAFCSYMAGVYPQAFSLLKQLEVQHPRACQPEACSLLKAMVLVKMKDWESLGNHLDGFSVVDSTVSTTNVLLSQLQELLLEEHRPVDRNPEKARLLSTFLPGTGHIYAGEPGQGILNGFSQLASLGTAALLAYNQLYISGFIIGLGLFQSFYFGGIRHAGELTEERNLREMNAYQRRLSELLIAIYQPHSNEP